MIALDNFFRSNPPSPVPRMRIDEKKFVREIINQNDVYANEILSSFAPEYQPIK